MKYLLPIALLALGLQKSAESCSITIAFEADGTTDQPNTWIKSYGGADSACSVKYREEKIPPIGKYITVDCGPSLGTDYCKFRLISNSQWQRASTRCDGVDLCSPSTLCGTETYKVKCDSRVIWNPNQKKICLSPILGGDPSVHFGWCTVDSCPRNGVSLRGSDESSTQNFLPEYALVEVESDTDTTTVDEP